MKNTQELLSLLEKKVDSLDLDIAFEERGLVLSSGDGVATVYGLREAILGEILLFENNIKGLILSLEQDQIGVALLSQDDLPKEGSEVRRTGKLFQVPVGDIVLGRVVNTLGESIDEKGDLVSNFYRDVEVKAPGVMKRKSVHEPLRTGILAIDSMIPIGRGQRELIIGDRKTGKTTIALDTIVAQAQEGVKCFYVAIGQKQSTIRQIYEKLKEKNCLEYTTILVASASDSAALQFLAPYAACTMAEYFRDKGEHALIIYDDLNKHAQAYRQLSLVLKRPPGREAYPGDIFYLHSRLLERACKLESKGSLTALPIVETQEGDVSAFIPTNIISITDGQIYLESDLFFAGIKPAINVGLSVSRVGGSAQIKAMRQVASSLRISLAQYRELVLFTQFGSDLDEATKKELAKGERFVELLKQNEMDPYRFEEEVALIFLTQEGYFDKFSVKEVEKVKKALLLLLRTEKKIILDQIQEKKELTEEIKKDLLALKHA